MNDKKLGCSGLIFIIIIIYGFLNDIASYVEAVVKALQLRIFRHLRFLKIISSLSHPLLSKDESLPSWKKSCRCVNG